MCRVEDLRAYLHSLDVETLAGLLHEQAERDPGLATRLRLRAGAAGDGTSGGEAAKIGAVLDTLQRMLDARSQADLAPLARRTVDRITAALDRAEDPSGEITAGLHRAVKLYARACAAHPHQPERLADWILGVEFDHPGRIELTDFAEALGKSGLARIKSTVDSVLADPAGDGVRRRRAERLNEQLAEISGDVDALLEILSKRLPPLEVSFRIVRVLRTTGRTTEAIAHAAKALAQGTGPARGPAADALAETFEETLRQECALPVRLELAELPQTDEPADEPEEIADEPADEPAEEIAVCRRQIEELIERRDSDHYRQAAQRLRKLRTLYRAAGRTPEFADYLAELVGTHRRKTRLLTEIRNARIALPRTRSAR